MIPHVLDLDELPESGGVPAGAASLEPGAAPPAASFDLSVEAVERVRARKRFRIGDYCATRRSSEGRTYFRVAEVADDGHSVRLIADETYRSGGRNHAGFGGARTVLWSGDIERRLTQEQWGHLQSVGFPLALVGALREAKMSVALPLERVVDTRLEIARVCAGGDFVMYSARVGDDLFQTLLSEAPCDPRPRARLGLTWLDRSRAATMRYFVRNLTAATHELEIVRDAVERYILGGQFGRADGLCDDD
jgi:hypothetical protein